MFILVIFDDVILRYLFFLEVYVVKFARCALVSSAGAEQQVFNYDPGLDIIFDGRGHLITLNLLDELLDHALELLDDRLTRLYILLQLLHLDLVLLLGYFNRLKQIIVHFLLLVQVLANLVHLLAHPLVLEHLHLDLGLKLHHNLCIYLIFLLLGSWGFVAEQLRLVVVGPGLTRFGEFFHLSTPLLALFVPLLVVGKGHLLFRYQGDEIDLLKVFAGG